MSWPSAPLRGLIASFSEFNLRLKSFAEVLLRLDNAISDLRRQGESKHGYALRSQFGLDGSHLGSQEGQSVIDGAQSVIDGAQSIGVGGGSGIDACGESGLLRAHVSHERHQGFHLLTETQNGDVLELLNFAAERLQAVPSVCNRLIDASPTGPLWRLRERHFGRRVFYMNTVKRVFSTGVPQGMFVLNREGK